GESTSTSSTSLFLPRLSSSNLHQFFICIHPVFPRQSRSHWNDRGTWESSCPQPLCLRRGNLAKVKGQSDEMGQTQLRLAQGGWREIQERSCLGPRAATQAEQEALTRVSGSVRSYSGVAQGGDSLGLQAVGNRHGHGRTASCDGRGPSGSPAPGRGACHLSHPGGARAA